MRFEWFGAVPVLVIACTTFARPVCGFLETLLLSVLALNAQLEVCFKRSKILDDFGVYVTLRGFYEQTGKLLWNVLIPS